MSIVIKNRTIGEGVPLICAPVIGDSIDVIKRECRSMLGKPVDIVEWRADYYLFGNEPGSAVEVMKQIRSIVRHLPVIFTYRTAYEGGEERYGEEKRITPDKYVSLIKYAADNMMPDIIDIECGRGGDETMEELIHYVHDRKITVIGSMHDFNKTPDEKTMEDVFERMHRLGADIFKMAVMPETPDDVLKLMTFSRKSKLKYDNPVITISMGRMGVISRIAGELDGSAITFASVSGQSAPGQIAAARLIRMLRNVSFSNGNIYLTGFMGCGKSTVARELQKRTGRRMTDIDAAVVEREGMSVADIFEKKGEKGFREIETKVLREESKTGGSIIACGGGIVLKDENITIMKRYGTVVLLTARPENIYKRVCNDKSRPLLNSDMSVGHIESMLKSRKEAYERAADIVIETDDRRISDIVFNIIKII